MKEEITNKKDKFSKMDTDELIKIIKMLTIEIDGGRGLPVPRWNGWSDKIMRQFIRFCYRNLKEGYIARVELVKAFEKDNNNLQ